MWAKRTGVSYKSWDQHRTQILHFLVKIEQSTSGEIWPVPDELIVTGGWSKNDTKYD